MRQTWASLSSDSFVEESGFDMHFPTCFACKGSNRGKSSFDVGGALHEDALVTVGQEIPGFLDPHTDWWELIGQLRIHSVWKRRSNLLFAMNDL